LANHILQHMHEKPHTHTITLDNLDLLQEGNKPYQSMHIHKQMNAGIELMNADEGEVNSCLFNLV
jgi:hypothetical protein